MNKQLTGWLVVNEFVTGSKFNELFGMLLEAAQSRGISLQKRTGGALWYALGRQSYRGRIDADFILFWDKDVKLAHVLETMGVPVFNSSRAIALCDDKSLTYLALAADADISMPRTYISPKKFHADGLIAPSFMNIGDDIGYPCVVKECFGSFGQQVYLAGNESELADIIRSIGERPYLIQEFITSSSGRDIRVQVVGDRVIAAMYRYNESDFRANVTNGGSMKKYEVDPVQADTAVRVCRRLGLDFAGVDILFGTDDTPVVCEVNSNAHFKNLYECTGINTAEHILEHIEAKVNA